MDGLRGDGADGRSRTERLRHFERRRRDHRDERRLRAGADEAGDAQPELATTYGTGELVRAALDAGCREFLIGLGGSATNDGGAGMAQALGVSLRDAAGRELPFGGAALERLCVVDVSGMDPRLADCRVTVASDVQNVLCGPQGASRVYGPQKGATPEMAERLDRALLHYAETLRAQLGADVANRPGAGAAGGLGAALYAFMNAQFRRGIDVVLELQDFAGQVQNADLVITARAERTVRRCSARYPWAWRRRQSGRATFRSVCSPAA